MDKLRIQGGQPLQGEIEISGAKNSALPALAACLLTDEPVLLRRVPQVRDIRTMEQLLEYSGASIERANGCITIRASQLDRPEAPYELVKTMRASSLVLGPLVARCGRARVSMPGGCAIGARPINLHVAALEQLGAVIHQEHGYIEAEAPQGLKGTRGAFRPHHRDRHRRCVDGGRAGSRRNRDPQRGARAGGAGPGRAAQQNGRADRGGGHARPFAFRA